MTRSFVFGLLLSLSLSSAAFAQGGRGQCNGQGQGQGRGMGMGMGQGRGAGAGMRGSMAGLSAEKKAQLKALREKHQASPCNGDQACRDARRAERKSIIDSK